MRDNGIQYVVNVPSTWNVGRAVSDCPEAIAEHIKAKTITGERFTMALILLGFGQLAKNRVSSMLRLVCPPSTQLYLRSTVDTAPQI
jgi:hypothetical protein